MNPLVIKAAPWFLAGVLALLLGLMTHLYLGERDEVARIQTKYDNFVTATETVGKEAQARKDAEDKEKKDNLIQVEKNHEAQLPAIQANAVAMYLAAHPNSVCGRPVASAGGSSVLGNGPGIRLDDGTVKECIPDEEFIRNAAEDATKIAAWIEYCQRNHCPVSIGDTP